MILDEKVKIRLNSRNFRYYKDKIDNPKNNEFYEIKISDLYHQSRTKINVICDVCQSKSLKPYREYMNSFNNKRIYCCSPKCAQFKNRETNIEKWGVDNVFQNNQIKQKIKKTTNEKYGVDYPSQSFEIRGKIKQICIEKWGVDNPMKCNFFKEKIKQTCIEKYGSESILNSKFMEDFRINSGTKIPDSQKSEFKIYQEKVRYLTDKKKSELFRSWNGFDFYDNEYIKENLNLFHGNFRYPTIDHRLSILYGFKNKIEPHFIAEISNLCITKRSNNSKKGSKINFKSVPSAPPE